MTVLLLLGGCMTFDWAVFPAERLDAYALDFELVPPDLVEEVRFEAEDGTSLAGVWARQEEPAPPLIFFHGYSSHIDAYTDRVDYYWSWGTHDVFLFDYRGYGTSEGSPDEAGVMEQDGLAAVRYVVEATGVPPEDILWLGLSLGASVAVHTNDEVPARAVVLESMFASTDAVLDDSVGLDLPPGWFFDGTYDNVAAVAGATSPLLVIHGLADDFVPPDHALEVYAAAPEPKELWQPEGVGHADVIEVLPEEYRARVEALADSF